MELAHKHACKPLTLTVYLLSIKLKNNNSKIID